MRLRDAIGIAVTAAVLAPAGLYAEAAQAPPAGAPAPAAPAMKRAAPARGVAELGFMKTAKVVGNNIVTTFEVKNMALGAIVGLTITEFWYDKAGNPVQGTGDRQRLKAPLQPGEVATVTLTSPKVAGMTGGAQQFKFEHNNGTIKTTALKSMK